jgi:phosphatidylinositol 3-kinase
MKLKANQACGRWNEWLTLPITYAILPLNSCLAITLWDLSPAGGEGAVGHAIPFGGTTLPLFDKDNQLQKGRQKCQIYRHKRADGNDNTTTPAMAPKKPVSRRADATQADKDAEELERMEKLFKKHEMGEIPRVDWLDQLVFRGFEKKAAAASAKAIQRQKISSDALKAGDKSSASTSADGKPPNRPGPSRFVLNVELERFDHPVVFTDLEYPPPAISSLQNLSASQSNVLLRPPPEVHFGPGINAIGESSSGSGGKIIRIYDPEIGSRDNPADTKHRRLFRSTHRNGMLDKDLKPNPKTREELKRIAAYGPTDVLSSEESDLVWKFRYYLSSKCIGLTKFVKSVNWDENVEAKQAVQLLKGWKEVGVDDALELFGPGYDSPLVRSYAVERLRESNDEDLQLYLLQLVQALKYEHIATESGEDGTDKSSLARFLISRAVDNFTLGNYFFWYLMVECEDTSPDQSKDNRKIYGEVASKFMVELVRRPGGAAARDMLRRQAELIAILSKLSGEIKTSNESIPKKIERAKHFLADAKNELLNIDPPLALPLDPSVKIVGVIPEETSVFKSSLCPIKLTFKTSVGTRYPIIFKTGDDLRQDQLVIQIIMLMDQLLRKEGFDSKLTPYKTLATGPTAGASQFIYSMPFQQLASKYKTNPALTYLRAHNPDDRHPLGIREETHDTYLRSCAGYCVITYILGVGDRHLDNLLLSPDGHFFHADFGFILGRDPKPFAPVMKLSKEMVDCMGGINSDFYNITFKQYCKTVFTALRKSSNLILNLFSLMVDANIPDIRIDPDKAVSKVKERFHLELNDQEAEDYIVKIIEDSHSAFAPVVIDKLHELVQAFRG